MKVTNKVSLAIITGLLSITAVATASNLTSVAALTDRIIICRFDDGNVTYRNHATGASDTYTNVPLDTTNADNPASYDVTSGGDANYAAPVTPLKVGRKAKGEGYPNWPPMAVLEHWVCLELPYPMQRGQTYRVFVGAVANNVNFMDFVFDDYQGRSEAIHVNQIGFVPSATKKYAYISHWIGGINGSHSSVWRLELESYAGASFHLVNTATGATVFSGTISKRKDYETGSEDVKYYGNPENSSYTMCDVWQCDFSAFQTPGEYKVVVEGVGCSYPFRIAKDIYAGPFYVACRGLYHHRSGPARGQPWTAWPKAVDHTPGVNSFEVVYTTWSYQDQGEGVGQMMDPPYPTVWSVPSNPAAWMGPDWGWGGYFDAGDWDRNSNHTRCAQQLLLAYELAPDAFYDGQLNIPESGNGIPDIIDEARWTIDFFRRLTGPTGGVCAGIECLTPTAPDNSATDRNTTWYAYAEEPECTIRTAAACAQLAYCLELAGATSEKAQLIADAEAFYNWAVGAAGIRDDRMLAAAWLYKITGNNAYQNQYETDNLVTSSTTDLFISGSYDQQMAVWAYVTTSQPGIDTTLKNKQIDASIAWGYDWGTWPASGRSYRMGGNYWQPTIVGAIVTTPNVWPLIMAYQLSGSGDYLSYVYTSCDYTLGGNPLNMTWITGAGTYGAERAVKHALNHDAYTDGVAPIIPGIVSYGPMNPGWNQGWYEHATSTGFVYSTFFPNADPDVPPYIWPTHELWTDNPYTIMNNEYTVHQNIAPAAAAYAYLWAITAVPADHSGDGDVDFQDFAFQAANWLRADCSYDNNFCDMADLDLTGVIDLRDLKAFTDRWME